MIRCDVVVTKDLNIAAAATQSSVAVPPSDIQHHLGSLLQSQEGTDITFQVGGEKFTAHRCVVAARSAVFRAELFGPMKEGVVKVQKRKKTKEAAIANTVIRIEDMDARVFGLLLGFIYSDSVPPEVEDEGESVWQHLLVVADR
ncbi:hypothetical protein BS78_01G227200 [Paspalum vaginatum]|nr:hypothetical protein BS78_01G227200 [Paspalum vaginatum]